jgi:predicted dinucleotide-binding enzyme
VQKQDASKASTSGGTGKDPDIDGARKKITDAVRAKHEAQQKILDSNEPLSDAEIASARSLLLQHLLPREKVMQALARLSSERVTNDPTIVCSCCLCTDDGTDSQLCC